MNEAEREKLRTAKRQRYQPFYDPRDYRYYYGEEADKRREEYRTLMSAKTAKTRSHVYAITASLFVIGTIVVVVVAFIIAYVKAPKP